MAKKPIRKKAEKKIPNDAAIAAEIAALQEIKPKVRKQSGWGDDHHAAIDAQVEVLEKRLSNNGIYDRFHDGDDGDISNVLDCALQALRWLEGSEDKLAENWHELKVKE